MIPTRLLSEVEEARGWGHRVEVTEADGFTNLIFAEHPIPFGFAVSESDVLLKFPASYPFGRPDMFWTDEAVCLKGGRIPQAAESIEMALGRRWRRFSWHPSNWNPATDGLATYLEFVNSRLAKAV